MITLEKFIIWFMLYSIVGWIYESILCSVEQRKWVNRGFLNGPYCPIYGCGALLDILALSRVESPVLLFFLSMLLASVLEYLTSYLMEKMFHARWWDYSKHKFNLNGRICLLGAVVFGTFSVVLLKFVQPFVGKYTNLIPLPLLHITAAVLLTEFVIDIAVTFRGLSGFQERLKILADYYEKIRETDIQDVVSAKYHAIMKTFSKQQKRMLAAFPEIKESFRRLRNRKRDKE